jgi:hypothetical protein
MGVGGQRKRKWRKSLVVGIAKNNDEGSAAVAHAYNPSTQEAEARGSQV